MSLRDAINSATPEQIRAAQMIAEARVERDEAKAALTQIRERDALRAELDAVAQWEGQDEIKALQSGTNCARTGCARR